MTKFRHCVAAAAAATTSVVVVVVVASGLVANDAVVYPAVQLQYC